MKILNYVELIDPVRTNRTELYTKKHKNNQKIRKSSGTVRRDKIELVRMSSVRFENLLKFDSFTVNSNDENNLNNIEFHVI
jgi:hypothetical protein